MITVAIVDDDLLFAESLGEALSARGISVLATCDSIAECLARRAAEPDVLIVDMLLDGSLDGPTIREQWRRTHGVTPKVLAMTSYDSSYVVSLARRAGLQGLVPKRAALDDMVSALVSIADGSDVFVGPQATEYAPSQSVIHIIEMVAQGYSSAQIAARVGRSVRTVDSHIARLSRRSGVASRSELVALAVRRGWVPIVPTASLSNARPPSGLIRPS